MKALTEPLRDLSEYDQILKDIKNHNTPVAIDGCIDCQKCHLINGIGQDWPVKLIITYSDDKAKEICEDYRFFDRDVYYYPAKDIIFYSAEIHSNLIVSERMAGLRRLMDGVPVTVVTSVDGLLDRILPFDELAAHRIFLHKGDTVYTEELCSELTAMGFSRSDQVEGEGEFALRGGILDVWNLSDDCPYRIELWGDEIDSIRSFDASSQRSVAEADMVTVYPASEYILTQKVLEAGLHKMDLELKRQKERLENDGHFEEAEKLGEVTQELKEELECGGNEVNIDSCVGFFFKNSVSLLEYFDRDDSLIVLDEPVRIEERGLKIREEYTDMMTARLEKGLMLPTQARAAGDYAQVMSAAEKMRTLLLCTLQTTSLPVSPKSRYSLTVRSIHTYGGDFDMLVRDLKAWKKSGYRVVLVCRSTLRAKHVAQDLADNGLTAFVTHDPDRVVMPGEIMVIHGSMHKGIDYPLIKFAVIAESDIFGEEKKKRKEKRKDSAPASGVLDDLSVGDYVVHENYGIGIYRGIEKIEVDGAAKDYVKIEYAEGSNLYILATNVDVIAKYASKDAKQVKVNKMGGTEWNRTRTRVKGAVTELANDLVRLYAVRQSSEGYACGPDTLWQKEFEETFPYEETQDQLDAVAAVKKDMESPKIMDRLICGDVGFGKTEVAIRAAFKMVQEGRQCAVLVPTTILAQQHYNTFSQRMKDYPVNIGLLSRFKTKAEQKKTIADLEAGRIDIIIGTHRLLSDDVAFKDLGLLVVDEEQRFGVAHKEKIKKMKETVDVLTLTATPIPRTLNMSMIGIRDMSLLEEPPVDRVPIQTYVMEYSDEMVREAINRELARGGQVYYVFNRIAGIEDITAQIAELVPDASVAYAHGRMNERELERIMYDFINGEIDVLVSTTIVETGLDIPNVNTMIIHDADKMGLAQLYQLRGRVGRSNRTAYAFLMYRRDRVLKEVAEKRLLAIRDFSALGSGYKIAMRDLEIRGAGNLLGEKQSGHMAAVGYDLYCKLLSSAVSEAKGEEVHRDFETTAEIDTDAYIPDTYISNEIQKLDMYKRIASIRNEDEYGDIVDELTDRFGDPPNPAENLLMIALIRAEAHNAGIERITYRDHLSEIYFDAQAAPDMEMLPVLKKMYRQAVREKPGLQKGLCLGVDMRGINKQAVLPEIRQLVFNISRTLYHQENKNVKKDQA